MSDTPEQLASVRTVFERSRVGESAVNACRGVPHSVDGACTCTGCWSCVGHTVGCTCDIDWECVAGRHTATCGVDQS